MKYYKPLAWMMAIAIASTTLTACSLDGNEPEKPFTTCPASETTLYACGVNESGTRSIGDTQNVLFTENDIEWFDVTTRELRFCDTMAPLKEQIPLLASVDFCDELLFGDVVEIFIEKDLDLPRAGANNDCLLLHKEHPLLYRFFRMLRKN